MTEPTVAELWAVQKQRPQHIQSNALFANPKLQKNTLWKALTNDEIDATLVDSTAAFLCELKKSASAKELERRLETYKAIVVLVPSNHAMRNFLKSSKSLFEAEDYVLQMDFQKSLETSPRFAAITPVSGYTISIKLENKNIIISNLNGTEQTLRILKQYAASNGTIYIVDTVYRNVARQAAVKSSGEYQQSEGIVGRLTSGSLSKATAYNALTIPVYNNEKLIKTAATFMAQVKTEIDVQNILSSSTKPITVFVPRNEAFPKRDRPDFTVKSHILVGVNVKNIQKLENTPYTTLLGKIQLSYVDQKLGSIFRKLILVNYAGEATQSIVILDKYAIENGTIYIIDQLIRGYDTAAAGSSVTPQDLPNVYTRPLPEAAVGTYSSEPGYGKKNVQPKF